MLSISADAGELSNLGTGNAIQSAWKDAALYIGRLVIASFDLACSVQHYQTDRIGDEAAAGERAITSEDRWALAVANQAYAGWCGAALHSARGGRGWGGKR